MIYCIDGICTLQCANQNISLLSSYQIKTIAGGDFSFSLNFLKIKKIGIGTSSQKDTSQIGYFIERHFIEGNVIDRTFHRQDISQIRYFIDRKDFPQKEEIFYQRNFFQKRENVNTVLPIYIATTKQLKKHYI